MEKNDPNKAPAEFKIKLSKISTNDIKRINALKTSALKKRYSLTGPQLKVLRGMVKDFNAGNISLSKVSRKSSRKSLPTKERLNEVLESYEAAKKKQADVKQIQKNAKNIKKIVRTESKRRVLDDILDDLNKGKISNVDFIKSKLNLVTSNKREIRKFLNQYRDAKKKNRGLSYIITKSKQSLIIPKLQWLIEEYKKTKLTNI